jgi:ElaB/YqjD/DUF883 family membrane-anchored ribosome-binding protein
MTETSGSDDNQASARQAIRDGIDDAYAKASKTAQFAVERTKDVLDQARGRVSDAYSSGREKASEVYATASDKATIAGRSASNSLESNPLGALLGGLAIGVVVGALLPRTERETEAFGAVGQRVRAAAGDAVEAAKDAGRDKLDELGLSREHASDTVKSLIDGVLAAAGSAGAAALQSAKNTPRN